jgi:Substrate binding domain of ABC-type glycine betaine transport system
VHPVGTTVKYATAHHLTTIADLTPLGKSVTIGGLPEFQTRAQALVGLKKAYGIDPTFAPIASGLFYNALDSGQVDTSDVFTTDPELTRRRSSRSMRRWCWTSRRRRSLPTRSSKPMDCCDARRPADPGCERDLPALATQWCW